jgi:hypothetical protein
MKFIESKCKVCNRPVVAKFYDPAPGEADTIAAAVDKWLPLLTCNRCYDAHDQRNRSGEIIFGACLSLARIPREKRTREMIDSTRRALEPAMKSYAQAIAMEAGLEIPIYHDAGIDVLIEKPEHCSRILRAWREKTRESAMNQRETA